MYQLLQEVLLLLILTNIWVQCLHLHFTVVETESQSPTYSRLYNQRGTKCHFKLRFLWIQKLSLYNTDNCFMNNHVSAHFLVCFLLHAKDKYDRLLMLLRFPPRYKKKNTLFFLTLFLSLILFPFHTGLNLCEENNSLVAISLSVCWQSNIIMTTWVCSNTLIDKIHWWASQNEITELSNSFTVTFLQHVTFVVLFNYLIFRASMWTLLYTQHSTR